MQLKFSKKSFNNERASSRGGNGMNVRRRNISLKISGFQYTHLLSSTAAVDIISWKELSPVFSLTHSIPLGEKMENPDEEPIECERVKVYGLQRTYQYILFHHSYL